MNRLSGHTILELVIATLVFSLFLFGAFTMFSFCLKNYRLIDTRSQAQNQAEIALSRIVSDLLSSDISSMVIGTSAEEYMVFETAIDPNTHEFKRDMKDPLWQGYVLYYTYPRDPNSIEKKLLRKYVPHTQTTTAKEMTSIALYLTGSCNSGEELRTVARDIYDLEIGINSNSYMVDINLVTWKSFSERRLAYQKDFSDNVARETVRLNMSVMLRNTRF